MHFSIILIALGLAVLVRLRWSKSTATWANRWQQTLGAFLFPPILLLLTSISVLGMGHHGTMLWQPVGWLGCHIALVFLAFATVTIVYLLRQQWRSVQQMRSYPLTLIANRTSRVLEVPTLFAAQVGIWQPELVVSRGLLQSLEAEQIEAVLGHEEAHAYYRDTFWFFWLNGVRRVTFWLPRTELLWQELLLLRELRADHWASQHVDALVLAESLICFVQFSTVTPNQPCATFHETTSQTRLEERIEFLLTRSEVEQSQWQLRIWLLTASLPILTLPFHV